MFPSIEQAERIGAFVLGNPLQYDWEKKRYVFCGNGPTGQLLAGEYRAANALAALQVGLVQKLVCAGGQAYCPYAYDMVNHGELMADWMRAQYDGDPDDIDWIVSKPCNTEGDWRAIAMYLGTQSSRDTFWYAFTNSFHVSRSYSLRDRMLGGAAGWDMPDIKPIGAIVLAVAEKRAVQQALARDEQELNGVMEARIAAAVKEAEEILVDRYGGDIEQNTDLKSRLSEFRGEAHMLLGTYRYSDVEG